MAWWNDPCFLEGLEPEKAIAQDCENFPDADDWEGDPGDELTRRIGARNILQAYYAESQPDAFRKNILACKWLCKVSPLPGVSRGTKILWQWLLDHAVVCPVFIPAVIGQDARFLRFDVIFPASGKGKVPVALVEAAKVAERRHGDSVKAARKALKTLEKVIPPNWMLLVEDRGITTEHASGSLGLALAAWAAYMHRLNKKHEALPALAGSFSVTGCLNHDGSIRGVGGVASKVVLAMPNRRMVVPMAHDIRTPWVTQVNVWQDAQARIAPKWTGGERGVFPPCEVLIGFASPQTEPHLKFATELRPRKAFILFHSDDEERSVQPARRVKRCLEENSVAWGGDGVPVILKEIDSRRPHLIERDVNAAIEEWTQKGVPESAIVLSIAGGSKLMAIAAANACSRGCPLMYLELGDQDQEYSIIGYDGGNHLRQTAFVKESPGVLAGFDKESLARCKNSAGKMPTRNLS